MNFDTFSALEKGWIKQAKALNKTIVFPEAGFSERTIVAGLECAKKLCDVVFLVKSDKDLAKYDVSDKNIRVVNITDHELTPIIENAYYLKRQHKGVTPEQAKIDVQNVYNYGAMMVDLGLVDGMVAGAEAPSKDVFGAAFRIVKAQKGKLASSFFLMIPKDEKQKPFVLSDGGVILNPTDSELADIAEQSAASYRKFIGGEPKVAMLSYSTHGSADGESAEKVRSAVEMLKSRNVDFVFDGEIQLDAAIVPEVAKQKCKNSPLKGESNVLVFPDLQSGNIGYKLIQRFGGYKAIGPIIQGLNKPINDLSRGTTAEEIVMATAITILQI